MCSTIVSEAIEKTHNELRKHINALNEAFEVYRKVVSVLPEEFVAFVRLHIDEHPRISLWHMDGDKVARILAMKLGVRFKKEFDKFFGHLDYYGRLWNTPIWIHAVQVKKCRVTRKVRKVTKEEVYYEIDCSELRKGSEQH